jgi:hypothetical protein
MQKNSFKQRVIKSKGVYDPGCGFNKLRYEV